MSTMTAVVMTGHGGPEMLHVRDDVAIPQCEVGQVRVCVAASSVNNTDIWTREGAYGTASDPSDIVGWRGVAIDTPRVQGADAVGVIDSLGAGVSGPAVGTRVLVDPAIYDAESPDATPIGLLGSEADGGFAEFLVVGAGRVHDVSASPLSDLQLAGLPTAYGTAMGMLRRAAVAPGQTIVVTGASGGVGVGLVQLSSALGLQVIAVSTSDKRDQLVALGADHVVDRRVECVDADILAVAAGGVDVVADVVGGDLFSLWPGVLRPHGRIVVAGAIAGPSVQIDLRQVYLDQRQILGSSMHTPAAFAELVDLVNAGGFSPPVAAVFRLDQIIDAQVALRASNTIGKIAIDVSS